jgi:hypothetical protein
MRNGWLILIFALLGQLPAQTPPSSRNALEEEKRDERVAMYLRVGRYKDARRVIDEMLKTEPRDDLKNVRAVFGSGPNMRVRRGSATFRCDVGNGVLLPLTVNGTRVNWLIDTGANVTMISDAEATRLGLVILDSEGRAADLAGGSTGVRTAVARRVEDLIDAQRPRYPTSTKTLLRWRG